MKIILITLALVVALSGCSQKNHSPENEAKKTSQFIEVSETSEKGLPTTPKPPEDSLPPVNDSSKSSEATETTENIPTPTSEPHEESLPPVNDSLETGHFYNKTFGISFDYPRNMNLKEENYKIANFDRISWFSLSNIILEPYDWPGLHDGELRIYFSYTKTNQGLEDFFQENDYFVEANLKKNIEKWTQFIGPQDIEDFNAVIGNTIINGHKFMTSSGQTLKMEEGPPSKSRDYYFKKDGIIFIITAATPIGEGDEGLLATADKIVNSIKFTDPPL